MKKIFKFNIFYQAVGDIKSVYEKKSILYKCSLKHLTTCLEE